MYTFTSFFPLFCTVIGVKFITCWTPTSPVDFKRGHWVSVIVSGILLDTIALHVALFCLVFFMKFAAEAPNGKYDTDMNTAHDPKHNTSFVTHCKGSVMTLECMAANEPSHWCLSMT